MGKPRFDSGRLGVFSADPWAFEPRKAWQAELAMLVLAVAVCLFPAVSQAGEAKIPPALQGTLLTLPGKGAVLRIHGKDQPLAGKTKYVSATLQDQRLINRLVRLEGTLLPGGSFEVAKLYTVRDGKLYKVRYFCEVCNIEALEPGDCVCCQKPTELQEIPVGAAAQ